MNILPISKKSDLIRSGVRTIPETEMSFGRPSTANKYTVIEISCGLIPVKITLIQIMDSPDPTYNLREVIAKGVTYHSFNSLRTKGLTGHWAKLYLMDEHEFFIATFRPGRDFDSPELCEVVSITNLITGITVSLPGGKTVMQGLKFLPDSEDFYDIKMAIAAEARAIYIPTMAEEIIAADREAAEREKVRLQEERDRKDRMLADIEQKRIERLATEKLFRRGKITAYTKDNKNVYGIPILKDEGDVLPDNTFVVEVTSLDAKDPNRAPIQSYCVRKFEGKVSHLGVQTNLSFDPPGQKLRTVEASAAFMMDLPSHGLQLVCLYAKDAKANLITMSADGMKFFAAIGNPDIKGCYEVSEICAGHIKTLGHYAPTQVL